MNGIDRETEEALSGQLALAFGPLHKRALGLAVGTASGAIVFLLTVFHVVVRPDPAPQIGLLREYFTGYTVSWPGAVVGGLWAFTVGFFVGWFIAFARNLVIATSIFITRTRQELAATRDFLDHI